MERRRSYTTLTDVAAAARRVVCRYNLLAGRPVEVQGGIETLIAHD
jgi:hypothetical protein